MAQPPRKRLGEILLEAGVIDATKLQAALGHQRRWGGRIGQALEVFERTLDDADGQIRFAAACTLSSCGKSSPRSLSILRLALRDRDKWRRFGACRSLGTLGPGAAPIASVVEELLHDRVPCPTAVCRAGEAGRDYQPTVPLACR